MIKQRISLGFSVLWRTYLLYFTYTFVLSLVLGFAFIDLIAAHRGLLLYVPAFGLVSFALLLTLLETGCHINLLRFMFGRRLNRPPAAWRSDVLKLSLLLTLLGTLNALISRLAPVDVWLPYKAYGGSLLFFVGVFAVGWTQATPSDTAISISPD